MVNREMDYKVLYDSLQNLDAFKEFVESVVGIL